MLFTVARPCGILTRFPILPALMRDTQTHLKELWNVAVPESKRKLPRATLEVKMVNDEAVDLVPSPRSFVAFDLRVSVMVLKQAKENRKDAPSNRRSA